MGPLPLRMRAHFFGIAGKLPAAPVSRLTFGVCIDLTRLPAIVNDLALLCHFAY